MKVKGYDILQQVMGLFIPERCILCGRLILFREHHCCKECFTALEPVNSQCDQCGGILDGDSCLICSARMWFISKNISVLEYGKGMKELLYQFKAGHKKRLHYHFGDIIYKRLMQESFIRSLDLIVPVPVSRKRKRQRGYNQARLMAGETSRQTGLKIKEVLNTVSRKENQKNMSYSRRFLNVPGRFRVKKGADVAGKSILLVDDVLTTGATINECARILKGAGAGEIFSVTLGRAPIKRLEK